jgi:hypothetical protein
VLAPGARLPDATVWGEPGTEPVRLEDAVAWAGLSLLCFTPYDWSPT